MGSRSVQTSNLMQPGPVPSPTLPLHPACSRREFDQNQSKSGKGCAEKLPGS
jgi:hypothetical protein